MALNFPDAPILNQEFVAVGKSWTFDGEKWVVTAGGGGTAGDSILEVNSTTVLPLGFDGIVSIGNTTSAIMITLPPFPNPSQSVLIKDTAGLATLHPITVSGGGVNIEGQANLVIMYNYGWLDLFFTGTQWVQQ